MVHRSYSRAIAILLAATLGAWTPANAQTSPETAVAPRPANTQTAPKTAATPRLSIAQIAQRVEAEGYRDIEEIEREGTTYEVCAKDKDGKEVELTVNASTGRIEKVEPCEDE